MQNNPLKFKPATTPHAIAPRALNGDPFMLLPPEMLAMIARCLSAADIFSLKIASPAVCNFVLPDAFYKRFLRTEFGHLPKLSTRLDEEANVPTLQSKVDWRGTWERLRSLVRTPRNPAKSEEWRHVDIGLKNRCRIWKIVKPIAEVLVHTSPEVLYNLHQPPQDVLSATTLVRGFMGTRSGKEGRMENVYLRGAACRRKIPSDDESQSEPKVVEYELFAKLKSISVWSTFNHNTSKVFSGLGFHLKHGSRHETRIFGREGPDCQSFPPKEVRRWKLRGFGFCLSGGIITGIKILYDTDPLFPTPSEAEYGFWPVNGFVRHIIVPKDWRRLSGMLGFMNSFGQFETIGLLEQKLTHDSAGRSLPDAPMNVPLSHEEASLWKGNPPPLDVLLLEREGPVISNWRLRGAEFEIWDRARPKLSEIVGWADEKALRGLEFHYYNDTAVGLRHQRLLGSKKGAPTGFRIDSGDHIYAMVIGRSDEGIHSLHVSKFEV